MNELISLIVQIENWEALKTARLVTIRVPPEITIEDLLSKIAKKGNILLISDLQIYGQHNYELILKSSEDGKEIILPFKETLSSLKIKNRESLILRKRKFLPFKLNVNIDGYETLQSVRNTSLVATADLTVKQVLEKITSKENVNIPPSHRKDFALFLEETLLEETKPLNFYAIKEGTCVTLKRMLPIEQRLSILIEDFAYYQCARKITKLFNRDSKVSEILEQILVRLNLKIEEAGLFQLIVLQNATVLEPTETLRHYSLQDMEIIILRNRNLNTLKQKELAGQLLAENLNFEEKIGTGSFGKVYKGKYKGNEVAVKVLSEVIDDVTIWTQFRNEVTILKKSTCPNIVKLYGTIEDSKHMLCIVMELCPRGSVYHILNDPNVELGWNKILRFSIDFLTGLEYLHTQDPVILHRDLKSSNLLVTYTWRVKLSDFSVSRLKTSNNLETLGKGKENISSNLTEILVVRGDPIWTAPELVESTYTIKSDIYSAGITLWEMIYRCITGKYNHPFEEYKMNPFEVIGKAFMDPQFRPTIPASCPALAFNLLKQCFDAVPNNRPSSTECKLVLEEFLNQYQSSPHMFDKRPPQETEVDKIFALHLGDDYYAIALDLYENELSPGKELSGEVYLKLEKPIPAQSVGVQIRGVHQVFNGIVRGDVLNVGKSSFSTQQFLSEGVILWKGDVALNNCTLNKGEYYWSFSFILPENLPVSLVFKDWIRTFFEARAYIKPIDPQKATKKIISESVSIEIRGTNSNFWKNLTKKPNPILVASEDGNLLGEIAEKNFLFGSYIPLKLNWTIDPPQQNSIQIKLCQLIQFKGNMKTCFNQIIRTWKFQTNYHSQEFVESLPLPSQNDFMRTMLLPSSENQVFLIQHFLQIKWTKKGALKIPITIWE